MSAIRIDQLSAAEAEYVVAQVWCILEKYQIASPSLAVRSQSNDLLGIQFAFKAQADADLVEPELLRTLPTGACVLIRTVEGRREITRETVCSDSVSD